MPTLQERLESMLLSFDQMVESQEEASKAREKTLSTIERALKEMAHAQALLSIESAKHTALIMCLTEILHKSDVISNFNVDEMAACAKETINEFKIKLGMD